MKLKAKIAVIALLLVCLALSLTASAQSTPRRVVTLGVIVPGTTKEAVLTVLEDGLATVGVRDVGKFGFSPSFPKGQDKALTVTVFDAANEPMVELGRVDVPVSGKTVESQTRPTFTIRVVSVR